jgi:hypothetical protein
MNDIIAITVGIGKLVSYVLAFILLLKTNAKRRIRSLILAAAYVSSGVVGLYLLPQFIGAHYDYWDVMFIENSKIKLVPMDLNFVINHLGLALCTGVLLAYLLESHCKKAWVLLIGLMSPIIGELFIRFDRWKGVIQRASDGDANKSLISDGAMAIAGVGPSISAGLFVLFALLIMFSNSRNRSTEYTEKA